MIRYIYDELSQPSGRYFEKQGSDAYPTYPDVCPFCGAAIVKDERDFFNGPVYGCGGQYTSKSQIQNHTDKWWGHCPINEEQARLENGRICDGCGEKRLEGTGFPITSFGWKCMNCGYCHEPVKRVL